MLRAICLDCHTVGKIEFLQSSISGTSAYTAALILLETASIDPTNVYNSPHATLYIETNDDRSSLLIGPARDGWMQSPFRSSVEAPMWGSRGASSGRSSEHQTHARLLERGKTQINVGSGPGRFLAH